jgi:D-alanyl-D-alanine carboxypeptidase
VKIVVSPDTYCPKEHVTKENFVTEELSTELIRSHQTTMKLVEVLCHARHNKFVDGDAKELLDKYYKPMVSQIKKNKTAVTKKPRGKKKTTSAKRKPNSDDAMNKNDGVSAKRKPSPVVHEIVAATNKPNPDDNEATSKPNPDDNEGNIAKTKPNLDKN